MNERYVARAVGGVLEDGLGWLPLSSFTFILHNCHLHLCRLHYTLVQLIQIYHLKSQRYFSWLPINLKPARPEGSKPTFTPVGPDQRPCNFSVRLRVNINLLSFPLTVCYHTTGRDSYKFCSSV